MTEQSHPVAGLHRHAMKLNDLFLTSVWPVQGNMSSLWAVLLIASFVWIISRLIAVFHKPATEIEELLGQDIPPVPEIALSGIGTNSVALYWKLPDNYHSPVKNYVHVNGVRIAHNDGLGPTVTIPGLVSGHRYTIRAVSTNSAGYSSYSQPIHVQVTPPEGHRAAKLLSVAEPNVNKRPSTGGRRVSSAISECDKEPPRPAEVAVYNESDVGDDVSKLTKRLETLRSENEVLTRQLEDEIADNEQSKAALTKRRDELKGRYDDKEKAWQESRKRLVDLERQSKAAQRKKSKKESEVQQKKKKRQQMQEEMDSWVEKQQEMRDDTEKLCRDRIGVEEKHALKLLEERRLIEDIQAQGKNLEEEIREWGIKIKALEEEKRLADEKEEEEEQEADRQEKEVETAYQVRLQDLEVRYQEIYGANLQIHSRLQQLQQVQQREPHRFAPTPANDFAYPAYIQTRSTRGSVSRAGNLPYQAINTTAAGFAPASGVFTSVQTSSPAFSMPFPALPSIDSSVSQADRLGFGGQHDIDSLTGGAQMSPSADDLLPSNLLSDDPNSTLRPRQRPFLLDSAFRNEPRAQDPQSPASQNSSALNFFPSPPDMSATLDSSSDFNNPDIDRALNNLNDAASRRPGGLFNFNSRRGQKPVREAPALGTLTQGQSQSFSEFDTEDLARRGHRKEISNPWMNMGSLLSRHTAPLDDASLSTKSQLPRKSRRLFSSSKYDTNDPFYSLDRTSSPRPASTYSYDQQLLRPSSETHPFPFSATDHLRLRNSPIGTDWASLGGGAGAYSNNHSRRQSIQHGSTSNLSLGSTPLDFDDIGSNSKPAPVAPIGAGRPGKSRKQKLNPGAPSFISNVFSRGGSESKRTPKSDRGSFDPTFENRRRSLDIDPMTPGFDDSPPVSRQSRDGHSIIASTTDSHDSLGAESDVTGASTSTGTTKENFMSRLTRKSSSGKFWSSSTKEKKGHSHTGSISGRSMSRRKSSEIPPVTPSEADEDAGSDYLGRFESNPSTPMEHNKSVSSRAGRSWTKMMGMKAKKADSTTMSETSESRTEDD